VVMLIGGRTRGKALRRHNAPHGRPLLSPPDRPTYRQLPHIIPP
jgi:hypothetical protein